MRGLAIALRRDATATYAGFRRALGGGRDHHTIAPGTVSRRDASATASTSYRRGDRPRKRRVGVRGILVDENASRFTGSNARFARRRRSDTAIREPVHAGLAAVIAIARPRATRPLAPRRNRRRGVPYAADR